MRQLTEHQVEALFILAAGLRIRQWAFSGRNWESQPRQRLIDLGYVYRSGIWLRLTLQGWLKAMELLEEEKYADLAEAVSNAARPAPEREREGWLSC